MLWIFLLAVMSGIGSSLLLINSFVGATRTVLGDLLAMVAVFFDVLITIGQIEYLKQHRSTDSILLNLHIFLFLLLLTAPAILALHFLGVPILTNVTLPALLLGVGIGLFVGFGQFLNYEAFKRIDGYLAFMMFNLSVLITFVIEVFIKAAVRPTVLLLLSATLILSSSVLAELINTHCQRKGR
jgi:drug/metabolite transporter (DMT)-like permease